MIEIFETCQTKSIAKQTNRDESLIIRSIVATLTLSLDCCAFIEYPDSRKMYQLSSCEIFLEHLLLNKKLVSPKWSYFRHVSNSDISTKNSMQLFWEHQPVALIIEPAYDWCKEGSRQDVELSKLSDSLYQRICIRREWTSCLSARFNSCVWSQNKRKVDSDFQAVRAKMAFRAVCIQ